MSVDKTINDMSQVLEQIRVLVTHLNAKVEGITDRLNQTLDTFDHSIAAIASDANIMTNKVGNTVSQAPDAWVYYTLSIILIAVFVLLAIFLVFQVGSRCHGFYVYVTDKPDQQQQQQEFVKSPYQNIQDPLPRYESKPQLPVYAQPQKQPPEVFVPPSSKRSKASASARSAGSSMRSEEPGYAKVRREGGRNQYQNEPLLHKEAEV
uniref:Uncharacterized protein n=1 Tax=Plectus sambesii TaxID=2011161 RepID=A0A914US16_9BILA